MDCAVSELFWHRIQPCAMKYAIISDIHANPTAFKAVLADARRQKADRIVCLGDVTGYGYDAVESYMLAKENCDVWLLGNHDAACAGVDAETLIRNPPSGYSGRYDFSLLNFRSHYDGKSSEREEAKILRIVEK